MDTSIMPLVEENRRLMEENKALRTEINNQAVRWDQWLDQNVDRNLRNGLVTVRVDLSHLEMILEPDPKRYKLASKLMDGMQGAVQHGLQIITASPVYRPENSLSYRFTFVGFKP
jgi:hypothetical protein